MAVLFLNSEPLISIIVPARNEVAGIKTCLRSILAQEPIEGGFEILVVDGMSKDGTREVVQKIASNDSRVQLLDNPRGIVPTAMNIGVRAARGQIIIRMDAHSEYASDYVYQCIKVMQATGADNVGGPHRAKGYSYLQRAIAATHHSSFAMGGALSHNLNYEGYVDTVIYGCWHKDILIRIGLFDEELVRNQDDELNFRLTRAGGKIWQSPIIRSWYQPRSSVQDLFHQYFQYGYWKVKVIQKHKYPASWRHLVPAAILVAIMTNIALWPFFPRAIVFLAIMTIAYLGAIMIASFSLAKLYGWELLPLFPLIFVCLHLAYGVGFLRGVIDFIIFRRQPSDRMKALTR
jgi:succinoglycan biosynthesis protein ExoA